MLKKQHWEVNQDDYKTFFFGELFNDFILLRAVIWSLFGAEDTTVIKIISWFAF